MHDVLRHRVKKRKKRKEKQKEKTTKNPMLIRRPPVCLTPFIDPFLAPVSDAPRQCLLVQKRMMPPARLPANANAAIWS
jgi:hypothetical protein